MTHIDQDFPPDFSNLNGQEWLHALRDVGQLRGFSEILGSRHEAICVEGGETLLVSFETIGAVETLSGTRSPIGWDLAQSNGWTSLTLLSHGDTWFRDETVYAFFDRLLDECFFDGFESVIFCGAGPCGYAAAAYCVCSPGARVLLFHPQATLDPRVTDWDDRFTEERRRDFTTRFGFAPDMIDAAARAHVIYDPRERLDAMHSALFERANVRRFRAPFMSGGLYSHFRALDLVAPLLEAVADDELDTARFAELYRARRMYGAYLRRLLVQLDHDRRPGLTRLLCRYASLQLNAPRFKRRLAAMEEADAKAAQEKETTEQAQALPESPV